LVDPPPPPPTPRPVPQPPRPVPDPAPPLQPRPPELPYRTSISMGLEIGVEGQVDGASAVRAGTGDLWAGAGSRE
jgi:hypothetical protein